MRKAKRNQDFVGKFIEPSNRDVQCALNGENEGLTAIERKRNEYVDQSMLDWTE